MPDMNDDNAVEATPVKKGPRKASEVVAETEARVRAEAADEIAALKAQLEQVTTDASAREEELLKELSAKPGTESVTAQAKPAQLPEIADDTEGAITVSFVSNDMTILGKLWFQGEELTVAPGTPQWDELWDANRGKSYLEYTEDEQVLIWGERKFRPGKWSGQGYEALLSNPDLSEEERAELESILNKRKSRSAAPAGSTVSNTQRRSPVSYS